MSKLPPYSIRAHISPGSGQAGIWVEDRIQGHLSATGSGAGDSVADFPSTVLLSQSPGMVRGGSVPMQVLCRQTHQKPRLSAFTIPKHFSCPSTGVSPSLLAQLQFS